MIVRVNLDGSFPSVELVGPNDFKAFHVEVVGDKDRRRLAEALEQTHAGYLDPESDDAYITVGSLILMAEGQVGEGWQDGLDKMVEFARSKGWVDDSARSLQAHIVWSAE